MKDRWKDLDYPPPIITVMLLMLSVIGLVTGGEFGRYMALTCLGLWFGWVIVWNFIVKPRL